MPSLVPGEELVGANACLGTALNLQVASEGCWVACWSRASVCGRAVVLTLFVGVAFAAIDNVALVFLTRDELGGGSAAFGVVTSAFGFGMLATSLVLTRWNGSCRRARRSSGAGS